MDYGQVGAMKYGYSILTKVPVPCTFGVQVYLGTYSLFFFKKKKIGYGSGTAGYGSGYEIY